MGQKKNQKVTLHLEPFLVHFTSSFSFTVMLFTGHNILNIGHCMLFTFVFVSILEINHHHPLHVAVVLDRRLATEDLQI